MTPICYLRGDATCPQAAGPKTIAHICNDLGGWGKGFVLALAARWAEPEEAYRLWYKQRDDFRLGSVRFIPVDTSVWVANMLAQRGIKTGSKGPPIRYDALEECLGRVAAEALDRRASVHMPRIGCGLAGGKWERVEPLIEQTLGANDIAVSVYDY